MTANVVDENRKVGAARNARTAPVLLFASMSATVEQLVPFVDKFRAEGADITVYLMKTGDVSQWCSRNDVYYHLYGCDGSFDPNEYNLDLPWLVRLTARLHRTFRTIKPGAVVFLGMSPYTMAARLAAWQAGIPLRVSRPLPSDASGSARCQSIDAFVSTRIITGDGGIIEKPHGKPSLLASIDALALAVRFAWNWMDAGRGLYLAGKRVFDVIAAVVLLTLFSPLILLKAFSNKFAGQQSFAANRTMGRGNEPFDLYRFADASNDPAQWTLIQRLPSLINVIRGELHFVGLKLRAGLEPQPSLQWLSPGLFSWADLKATAGASAADLQQLDEQYLSGVNLLLDVKILLSSLRRIFWAV